MTSRQRLRKEIHPDEVRMTLGEHLDELRSRLIKALVALVAGALIAFVLRYYVMGFLCWPVLATLKDHNLPTELKFLNPAEAFLTELKVSLIVGFIISAPISLSHVWGFVAAGLYPHERKWVQRFAPVSIVLFFVGALFLLLIVSPILLNFLLSYRRELPDFGAWMPRVIKPKELDSLETEFSYTPWEVATTNQADSPDPPEGDEGQSAESQQSGTLAVPPPIPAFAEDPENPPEGMFWFNTTRKQLRARYGEHIFKMKLTAVDEKPRLMPEMRITEYIMFVLHLSAAFGIGFQVPVVVAFIGAAGIASAKEMGALRRYVWLAMSVCAAVITPPDVTSMVFLLLPMAILYELGLIAARFLEKERNEQPV
jgi:sec-independent protein translocase protein TatC